MSTDEQARLDAYIAASVEPDPESSVDDEPRERPAWTPGDAREEGSQCQGCGAHVTSDWVRVMGDADGQAHACPRCASQAELVAGAAVDPAYEHRTNTQGAWR